MRYGCILFALLAVGAGTGTQDADEKTVFSVTLPRFYLDGVADNFIDHNISFNENARRQFGQYEIQWSDEFGRIDANPVVYDWQSFSRIAQRVLGYGVREGELLDPICINKSYSNFVRKLFNSGLINKKELGRIADSYGFKGWIESLYILSEAVPGVFSQRQWQRVFASRIENKPSFQRHYFRILCKLKLMQTSSAELREIQRWAESTIIRHQFEKTSGYSRDYLIKLYLALLGAGMDISPEVKIALFNKCMLGADLEDLHDYYFILYRGAGLPLLSKEELKSALYLLAKNGPEPDAKIVALIRKFELEFPADLAPAYIDFFLKTFGNFEDIRYLMRIADPPKYPKLWLSYGDSALWWYSSRKNRKAHNDSGYYYSAAVECYLYAAGKIGPPAGGWKLSETKKKILLDAITDMSVSLFDIMRAYELIEPNVKHGAYKWKFEERIKKFAEIQAGAFFKSRPNCNKFYCEGHDEDVTWRTDEFGRKIIPFRDMISFAAFYREPEYIKELSLEIADYAKRKLKEEGREMFRLYQRCPRSFNHDLTRLDTPIFQELKEIINFYEMLKFREGARTLAQSLHEAGFDLAARKLFHLGGLGKEAEEQYYSKHSDDHWLAKQKEFSKQMRERENIKK